VGVGVISYQYNYKIIFQIGVFGGAKSKYNFKEKQNSDL
jgi:hypothetical protein